MQMTNVISRLSETPGAIRRAGPRARRRHRRGARRARRRRRRARAAARGGRRVSVPAAHLAVRPRRPARPRREGARLARARGDRRPRGRRRARARRTRRARTCRRCSAEPREKPVYVRVNRRHGLDRRPRGRRALADRRRHRAEGRARPTDVPVLGSARRSHCLIESALGRRGGVRDRVAPRRARASRSARPTCARRPARSRRVSTGRASRIVNAAVAAGLPRPPQSVYPHVARPRRPRARRAARGRELGHLGRAAIHPDQLPVIEQAYLPTAAEVERARATIERLEEVGVGTLGRRRRSSTPAMLGGGAPGRRARRALRDRVNGDPDRQPFPRPRRQRQRRLLVRRDRARARRR